MKRVLAALAIVLVVAAPAAAAPQDVANSISSQIMSPFCDGVTLHDCPSQAAADLRDEIESWAARGWSRDKIMTTLEQRYGPKIDAVPDNGEGLAAWLVPTLAVVGGLALAIALARRWAGRRVTPPVESISPEDRARVDRELASFREQAT